MSDTTTDEAAGYFVCECMGYEAAMQVAHNPEHVVIVTTPDIIEYAEQGVQVYRDGTVTNAFADGVVGVPEKLREQAAEEAEGTCPECGGVATFDWEEDDG